MWTRVVLAAALVSGAFLVLRIDLLSVLPFPLLILSTGSMRHLQSLVPDSAIDVRRFRPNLLVDLDNGEPWPELEWVGRRIRVGTAVLEIVAPCPRCVMITRAVADLPQDSSIMRAVVREANQNLGVYATVVEPGVVTAGDPVSVDSGGA